MRHKYHFGFLQICLSELEKSRETKFIGLKRERSDPPLYIASFLCTSLEDRSRRWKVLRLCSLSWPAGNVWNTYEICIQYIFHRKEKEPTESRLSLKHAGRVTFWGWFIRSQCLLLVKIYPPSIGLERWLSSLAESLSLVSAPRSGNSQLPRTLALIITPYNFRGSIITLVSLGHLRSYACAPTKDFF